MLPTTLLAIYLVGSPILAADGDPTDLGPRIAKIAMEQIDAKKTPGLGIAVLDHGQMIFAGGFGMAELENEVPVTPDSVFRIGSVTKQFTAAGILRLVEQGKLRLDDLVAPLIDDFDFQGHPVTVRHLLNHTSGIPSYTDLAEKWMSRVHEDLTPDEILDLVDGMPFHFEPGDQFEYNNSGYVMLGQLIDEVSGETWADWLATEFFEPIGLASIRYGSEDDLIPHRAQGYHRARSGGFRNDIRFSMTQPHGAGALVSSPTDLVRWSRALWNGEAVSPSSLALMSTRLKLNDGKSVDYGFGLQIGKVDDLAMISHGGGIFGFVSHLAAFPDADLHVAVLANCDSIDVGRLCVDIARIALQMETPPPLDEPLTAAELQHCAGRFVGPIRATVRIREAKVYLQGDGQAEIPLLHQGDLRFRASFDPTLAIRFGHDGEVADHFILTQNGADLRFDRAD